MRRRTVANTASGRRQLGQGNEHTTRSSQGLARSQRRRSAVSQGRVPSNPTADDLVYNGAEAAPPYEPAEQSHRRSEPFQSHSSVQVPQAEGLPRHCGSPNDRQSASPPTLPTSENDPTRIGGSVRRGTRRRLTYSTRRSVDTPDAVPRVGTVQTQTGIYERSINTSEHPFSSTENANTASEC